MKTPSATSCVSPASNVRKNSAQWRAHIIAWRDELARRGLGGSTIRHRLASLASLFEYLCEKNAVTHNLFRGVERPKTESGEGKTPAIGDHQARDLLVAPREDSIKSKRDRAILSTLLFHALWREELCKLKVKDARHARKGVPHLKVSGKGDKTRYLPLHSGTNALDYQADIAKVQEWLGHPNIATPRIYDQRRTRPEESPTFKVAY